MKKLAIVAVATALIIGAVTKVVAAQEGNWRREARTQFLIRHLEHDLNLTAAQRAQIKLILQKEKPAIQTIAADLAAENSELRTKTTFDESFVRSVAQKRSAILTSALVERDKVRAEIFAVLTPRQQTKANQIIEEFRSMVQERLANLGDQL